MVERIKNRQRYIRQMQTKKKTSVINIELKLNSRQRHKRRQRQVILMLNDTVHNENNYEFFVPNKRTSTFIQQKT